MAEQHKCELLPCPFCGNVPILPNGKGSQYEIECGDCGMAVSSVQICDLMTIEERLADPFTDYRYGQEYIDRARDEAIEQWNRRPVESALRRDNAALRDECVQARRTGQYWKDEHAAANKEIDALRAREERVVTAAIRFWWDEVWHGRQHQYLSAEAVVAAFRKSDAYPK